MNALFIIAPHGYQDIEYETPKRILEHAGINVTTASKTAGICHGKLGGTTTAALSLRDVDVSQYDIIIFVGGSGAVQYQQNQEAHHIAQEAYLDAQVKVLAAICIGPTILARAGVLKNKNATVWNQDQQQDKLLLEEGARYTAQAVIQDGKIVTADGPQSAELFGKKIIELLKRQN